MDYKTFAEKFAAELSKKTGIPMEQMTFKMVERRNFTDDDVLYVVLSENGNACGFEIRRMYEQLGRWSTFEKMVQDAYETILELKAADLLDAQSQLKAYEQIKRGLFVKVLNEEQDSPKIAGVIHEKLGDVCLCVYWHYITSDNEWIIRPVMDEMLVHWGITKHQLLTDALQVSLHADPPRVYLCEKLLTDKNYQGEDFMNAHFKFSDTDGTLGICLSNCSKNYGASVIFQPGVAEKLSVALGTDVIYILFSSSYETMIYSGNMKLESLRYILEFHNARMPQEGMSLSSHIFEYDKKLHNFKSYPPAEKN